MYNCSYMRFMAEKGWQRTHCWPSLLELPTTTVAIIVALMLVVVVVVSLLLVMLVLLPSCWWWRRWCRCSWYCWR